jgi:hypothetical protein
VTGGVVPPHEALIIGAKGPEVRIVGRAVITLDRVIASWQRDHPGVALDADTTAAILALRTAAAAALEAAVSDPRHRPRPTPDTGPSCAHAHAEQLTSRQVADLIDRDPRTVVRNAEALGGQRDPEGRWRFHRAAVDDWLAQRGADRV